MSSTDDAGGGASAPLATHSGRPAASQQPRELQRFLDILRQEGVTSYCEVGARHGDTFWIVMNSLPEGSKGYAIDLPWDVWGTDSLNALEHCVEDLTELGYDIDLFVGDSADAPVPDVDAVLIDADHRYESVKRDWGRFGNAKIVAFHDIDGEGICFRDMPIGVPRLWDEIKDDYRHEEIIDPSDHRRMGIGVIWR